jgi:hypothetical protein
MGFIDDYDKHLVHGLPRGDAGPTASLAKRRYVPDAADGGCRSLNTLTLNLDDSNYSFLPYIQFQVQYP